ncbi:cupin domain-containing protein [Xanthobacter sp. DSM 24535]|uniref:cupin domain-containing protein n=1 Tax=Roseixanthobacter psychrophilus TaxID=3119917 RepID=UPI003726FD9D
MRLHILKRDAEAAEATPVAANVLVSGTPQTRVWITYDAPAERLCAGEWEATPGKWRVTYEEWEYCLMVSGLCVVEGDDGTRIVAGPGDAFVLEPGFVGTWEVLETMRKHWVIRTPA